MLIRRLALAAALLVLPAVASAQNLLANGDFSAGLRGFTVSTTPGYLVSSTNECSLGSRFGVGMFCAVFGTPGTGTGAASLSQTVLTTPGASYLASLVTNVKPIGGAFFVLLSADGDRARVDCSASAGCLLTLAFTAASAQTVIAFGVQGELPPGSPPLFASGALIGNVRVVGVTTVPEPATLALTLCGLAVMGARMRRRKT